MSKNKSHSEEELVKDGLTKETAAEQTEDGKAEEACDTAKDHNPEEETESAAADAGEESDPEASGEEEGEKPSRSQKKKMAALEKELEAFKDRHLRTLAEYENFRKRTEREKADIYAFAVRDAMEKILPVMDNLERGVDAIPAESENDPFAEGMKQICKQFEKALDDIGVKPMNAEGKQFDPNLHQAVMHVEDPSLGKNVVAAELMKGYTYKDTVVRHAMVSVAN